MELSAGHTHMFMLNNEGDLTDEEKEDRIEEEKVGDLFGRPMNKDQKVRYDMAAAKIQGEWKKIKEDKVKAESKVSIVLSSQKNKKENMYDKRRKAAEEKRKQE